MSMSKILIQLSTLKRCIITLLGTQIYYRSRKGIGKYAKHTLLYNNLLPNKLLLDTYSNYLQVQVHKYVTTCENIIEL